MPTTEPLSLDSYLAAPLTVGEPDVAGALAVYPVFGPDPTEIYLSFAQGREGGVSITEVEGHASVNDLTITNPLATSILLYEGEEVLGAAQNRTFDVSTLIGAGAKLRVPVSCVEAGRWQTWRHSEDFVPAPQTAYPNLRRAKNRQVREALAVGMEARADQSAVWSEIAHKSARMQASSPTGAMHDIYESRRDRLGQLRRSVRLRDRQVGTLAAVGGRFCVLDLVSRPEVFAALHGPLVAGYALDALEVDERDAWEAPPVEEAQGFVSLASAVPAQSRPSTGLGRDLRFAADGVAGSALEHKGELIQLTAFPEVGDGQEALPGRRQEARAGRIRRPSRRSEAGS